MSLTEKEAKTKRCPFMAGERIASACMMWRVTGMHFTEREVVVRLPDGGGRFEPEKEALGKCGLPFERNC